MGCNCSNIKDLPTCINELVLGTISLVSQSVYVLIKNNSTKQFNRIIAESDVDGLVTVDLTLLPSNFFSENYNYDIWISSELGNPSEMLDIVIDGTDYNCLSVRFFKVSDEALESVYYSSLTVEIA